MNDSQALAPKSVRSRAKPVAVEMAEQRETAESPAPSGYRTRRDVLLSTRAGTLKVEANRIVRDKIIIEQLRRAGVKLDPLWD